MKPTDEERREAAENLRTMCVCGCRYAEQFYELLNKTAVRATDTTPSMSYITIEQYFSRWWPKRFPTARGSR